MTSRPAGVSYLTGLPFTTPGFSGFDGANPNGTWSLYVRDDGAFASGEFAGGWTIQITARVVRR
jgi:hypothetical protein